MRGQSGVESRVLHLGRYLYGMLYMSVVILKLFLLPHLELDAEIKFQSRNFPSLREHAVYQERVSTDQGRAASESKGMMPA